MRPPKSVLPHPEDIWIIKLHIKCTCEFAISLEYRHTHTYIHTYTLAQ